MRDPAFWWRDAASRVSPATLLAPAAALYGAIAAWRMARGPRGWRSPMAVVCVGNFTLGGTGKTPAAMALARLLLAAGEHPVFLSRGYGGRLAGPVRVCDHHRADEVGDEPLLLAGVAPTIVARDRRAGAAVAAADGASVLIMDDGLQNPSLAKDFALALVDGRRGIGNGRVFPAGPLRAPLAAQLDCVSAVLVVAARGSARRGAARDGGAAAVVDAARQRGLPIFNGELCPDAAVAAALFGTPVLAFAGIADPEKFFATLEFCGIPAAVRAAFPDHHRYTAAQAGVLLGRAERERLTLLTTEKDVARMRGDGAAAELAVRAVALPVTMEFAARERLGATVVGAVRSRRSNHIRGRWLRRSFETPIAAGSLRTRWYC